ncbi:hypothetical protein [Sandarakinorhabdus sp.]|uniref:hypothetical protein n=1 Tax=Sandarakinorhabdus sp. TaxID=1916663 RepID=UPI00333F4D22
MILTEKQRVVRSNYEAFEVLLPTLLATNFGQYVLLRDGQCAGLFNTAIEAFGAGEEKFEDGLFSVQKVESKAVDLGFFSHAGYTRAA